MNVPGFIQSILSPSPLLYCMYVFRVSLPGIPFHLDEEKERCQDS